VTSSWFIIPQLSSQIFDCLSYILPVQTLPD